MDRDAERWAAVEEATELLLEGEPQAALGELRAALDADPQNAYAYQYLGVALFELERFEAARDAYRAAVTLSPDYLAAWVGLSHALRQAGDDREAAAAANAALERFPDDGDALYAAGLAEAACGRRSVARKHLLAFLATKPELEVQLEVRGVLEMLAKGHEGDPFRQA
ncbi:MAG: tetratricopeptide repeat protein [Myxococcales bacterium]|nr:tetratricopeptide repeat protein [Myxococcales bacterium]